MTTTTVAERRRFSNLSIVFLAILVLATPPIYAAESAASPAGLEGPAQTAYKLARHLPLQK